MVESGVPNDRTPDYGKYPWKHVNSLTQVCKDSPVLVALELTTLTIYAALLRHAIRHRKLPVLIAGTIAGAVNEVTFTSIPMVNNFWHAQAWLMLGPRMPVWQPALYGFFLYAASQSAERLRLAGWHAISRAAAAGLLGYLTLFPLDAVCVRFVAYTWHDSDPMLADRWLGVAVGNGMFAAAFPACFAALLAATGPIGAAVLSTPAMLAVVVPITQYTGGGVPNHVGLASLLVAMATVVLVSAVSSRPATGMAIKTETPPLPPDWTLTLTVLGHFAVLLAVSALADPAAQKSVGFHQPISLVPRGTPCRVDNELSASGRTRRVFVCPTTMELGDFNPLCDPAAGIDQHWYALCGRPFGRAGNPGREQFVASLAILAAMGIAGIKSCQAA